MAQTGVEFRSTATAGGIKRNKEKRQILNWLCLFTYGSLNAVVLVRGHSLFKFEARREDARTFEKPTRCESFFLHNYTNSMPNALKYYIFVII